MASTFKSLRYAIFFALALSVVFAFAAEAGRPFSIMESETAQAAGCAIERFFDGLALGAMMVSGPSPGVGHSFSNAETLGGMKNSGPSPGVGHSFTTGTHQ
ncbi:unnamed protein product [Linum trigynum]|uniref:Transmembrane protein n=1 Tax=Linum trigynum TaxID=586398 RepID=A0AAV2DDZ3_9ROSI